MANRAKPKSAERSETREMPALELRAAFTPSTLNADKRTVQLTWTTGAPVMRGGWDRYWEELSLDPKHVRMGRLNSGAPLLDSHNADGIRSVIGVVENASLNKGQGVATVRFDSGVDGAEAMRKVQEGILRNVSVGYRVHKMEKVSDGADKLPVFRAVDWEPHELSMVPIGADAAAGVRSADPERNPCVFVTRNKETKMADDDETTNDQTQTGDSPAVVATRAAAAARIEDAKQRAATEQAAAEKARAEERIRVAEITGLGKRFKMGDSWTSNMVAIGASVEECRKAILDIGVERDGSFNPGGAARFEAGEDARDKFVRGGVAAILCRSGHADMIRKAKKVERLAHHFADVDLEPGEFGSMRMIDIARKAIELRGGSTRNLYGEDLIRAALQIRGDQGFNTTSDFSILLETAMNKSFVGQYALAPVTWPLWCGRKSLNDFRTSTFYRPGTFSVLDSLTEAGEVKHKNIADGEKRTITPGTKGNIIGITRRALVNDDLGAFQSLASGLGLAAAFTIEADAFAMISPSSGLGLGYGDGNPLFHSSRSNIGPTGAMSITTWDGSRATMAKQKDPSANQFLALRPKVWLGPVELGGAARQLNQSTTDPRDNKSQGIANFVMNMVETVVDSPYLSVTSTTRHYFLADPSLYPVFAVGFINGQEAPTIVSEQSFGFDGVQMKVVLDYGTALLDYRGAITCQGT
jgi:hypothetical protein